MNFNRQNKNAFQSKKVAINEFSLKSTLFPELINDTILDTDTISDTNDSNKVILNYKNILLKPIPEDFKPIVRIKKITEEEKELEDKIKYQNNAIKIIDKMCERWLKERLTYIELYGKDEYERCYIPLQDWEEKEESDSEDESEIEISDEENY